MSEQDNGKWQCHVSAVDRTGNTVTGKGEINVIVAVPPTTVGFKTDDVPANSDTLVVRLDEAGKKEVAVDCIATEARPEPEFKWYIGGTEITVGCCVIK